MTEAQEPVRVSTKVAALRDVPSDLRVVEQQPQDLTAVTQAATVESKS